MTTTTPQKWFTPVQSILLIVGSVLVALVAFGVTLEDVLGPQFIDVPAAEIPADKQRYLLVGFLGGIVGLILYAIQTFRSRRDKAQVLDYVVLAFSFSPLMVFPALVTLVGVLSRLQWRPAAWALGISAVATAVDMMLNPVDSDPAAILLATLAVFAVVIAAALWAGRRRERREAQAERLRSAEGRIHTIRAEERTRIARDLHDSLSHRLSLISLHAGALSYRDDLSVSEVGQAAGLLQESARQANDDLRAILSVLRDSDFEGNAAGADPSRPISTLIDEARAAGIEVTIDAGSEELAARVGEQPSLVAHAINRTVSEGLLNASKHAPGTNVKLVLRENDDRLCMTVSNPLTGTEPGDGTRAGLIGLKERAHAAGGHLEVRNGDAFVLALEVPWTK